ncbi:MAG TPA: general secretion pathway protein GspB [Burkholderiales bacterium]|nr:general secretion pathway protein GspB [Burkholderiales bacterium]
MSFILDALRKSEHERQRQGGPGLAEVAAAAPRTRTSVWAAAAVVLLIANLAAIGIVMLRRGRAEDRAAPAAATSVATAAKPSAGAAPMDSAAAPVASAAPPPLVARQPSAPPVPSTGANTPPMLQPADGSAAGTRNPLADEVGGDVMLEDPVLAERAASVPSGPPAVTSYPTQPGSVVYEPLPGGRSTVAPGPADLPTVDDLATGLPEMHVDLHVYSANPQERFVFVNKRRYREGETLQEGPRVEEITREGVVLSQQGRRFILPRQ